jgi:hypothetical protein
MNIYFKLAGIFAAFAAIFAPIIVHLWWLVTSLVHGEVDTTGEFIWAILGTIIPPVGWIHGVILIF